MSTDRSSTPGGPPAPDRTAARASGAPAPSAASMHGVPRAVDRSATVDEAVTGPPPEVNFWQTPTAQNLLPLLLSIAVHLVVILVAVGTYAGLRRTTEVVREQIIIPDANFADTKDLVAVENPGLGEDPTRPARQDQYPDAPANSAGWASKPSDTFTLSLMGGGSGDAAESDSLIGLGSGGAMGRPGFGGGSGEGDGTGPLAPFGVPGGGGGAPQTIFAQQAAGTRVKRVVFVCDASGSMFDNGKFDLLRNELRKAVRGLQPDQEFDVIFFREAQPWTLGRGKLVQARPDQKQAAEQKLNEVGPHGQTNAIPALQAAFDETPELIYLLTDGDFRGRDEQVRKYIRDRNATANLRINTIAFMTHGEAYEKLLSAIAAENNGNYRFVSADDLH